jgi:iron complex outermembrane recepter protein
MSNKHLAARFLRSTMLSSVAFAAALPALAQDEGDAKDTILVTGTRIQRADLSSPSAVKVVGSEVLEITNSVNLEGLIQKLPQVIPTLSANTNNGNPGAITLNLRGVGATRTLVLLDGMRLVPFSSGGAVDINMIPAALVSQAEIVTGGASAVYGSDAIGGVVNFRTKTDFEGFELNSSWETTEVGDGEVFNIDAVIGGNFADGRGNAVVYAGYTNRNPVLQGSRALFENALSYNPGGGSLFGGNFDPTGSSGVPTTRLFSFIGSPGGYDWTAAGLFSSGACPEGLSDTGTACLGDATFSDSGQLIPWINSGPNTTKFNYAPPNYLQTPQERYYVSGFANYDITDSVRAHVKGLFSQNTNPQQLAPTPFFSTVTIQQNNPFIDPAAINLLTASGLFGSDSDGDGQNDATVFIGRRLLENRPRFANTQRNSFQIQGGLEGDFGFLGDGNFSTWGWDVTAAFGRSTSNEALSGDASLQAFQDLVRTNQMDIFSLNSISQANVDIFTRVGISLSETEQTQIIGTIHGDAGQSPWADAAAAWVFGFEYREVSSKFTPDSFLINDVVGFNTQAPERGRFDAYEGFMETNIPIVQNVPFVHDLSFLGAYRFSDYSTAAGTTHTFSTGASWTPDATGQVRFRAQFQRAVRAPNVTELFSPQTNGFPSADDPCADGTVSGAGGFQTFTGAEQAIISANCIAGGVPTGLVGTDFQPNSQIEGLFGGNPGLTEETADTITGGVVVTPEAVPGLNVQIDYYSIDITNAIDSPALSNILEDCYLGGDPVSCALITRTGGFVTLVQSTLVNIAGSKTSGIDFNADYNFDPADWMDGWNAGTFALSFTGTLLLKDESQTAPAAPVFNAKGLHGNFSPRPSWRHYSSLTWNKGQFGAYGDWQFIGPTTSNRSALADLNSYSLFGLSAFYDINETARVTFGVKNLLDKDPQLVGDGSSSNPNTYVSLFDPLGRKFFGSVKLKF